MAKSSEYWKKRLENIATTQNKRADDYIETLELQYKKAFDNNFLAVAISTPSALAYLA